MKFKSIKKLDSNSTKYSDKTATRFKTKYLDESKPSMEKAWAYEVYRVSDGEVLATDGRLRSYEIAVKDAEETAQAYEEQGYGECDYDVFEDTDPTPMWNRKKTAYESKKSIEAKHYLSESSTERVDNTTSMHYGNKIFYILDLMSGDQIRDFIKQYRIYEDIEISEDENDINAIYDAIKEYLSKDSGKDFYHWLDEYCYDEGIFNYYVLAYHDGDKYIYYTDKKSKKPFTDDLNDSNIRTYKDKDDAERDLRYFSNPDDLFRKTHDYQLLTDIKVEPAKNNLFVITGKDTDTGDTYYWEGYTTHDWNKSLTDSCLMSKEEAAKELIDAKNNPYLPTEDELFKPIKVQDIIDDIPFEESLQLNKGHRIQNLERSLTKENTQYGVHSFSQSAIIFRGTEEECAQFIVDHNLWNDAEIYTIYPDDPHYLKEAKEKLTTYYQVYSKYASDSKPVFIDEFEYIKDALEEASHHMDRGSQVKIFVVQKDEDGNIVGKRKEVLVYSDDAIQDWSDSEFDVATAQEASNMFGKPVYSGKEDKLYYPTTR